MQVIKFNTSNKKFSGDEKDEFNEELINLLNELGVNFFKYFGKSGGGIGREISQSAYNPKTVLYFRLLYKDNGTRLTGVFTISYGEYDKQAYLPTRTIYTSKEFYDLNSYKREVKALEKKLPLMVYNGDFDEFEYIQY